MKQINEAHGQKKHNSPKDYISAVRKGNRDAEQDALGAGFHSQKKTHKTSKMDKSMGKKVDLNKIDMYEAANSPGRQDMLMKRLNYKNPYAGMSWDEYVEAKRKEREEESNREPWPESSKGACVHFENTQKNKIQITESDIHSLVLSAVKRIMNEAYDYRTGNPAIYVGTYGKYNGGSIEGAWVDLTDFNDKEEFLQYCYQTLHADEPDAELMFQDYENIPKIFVSESSIDERFWDYMNITDYDDDIKEAIANESVSVDNCMDTLENGDFRVWSGCKDMSDVAYEYVEELGAEGIGDNYFDFEAFGRDCSFDGPSEDSGAESIYQEYGVEEGDNYDLGEAIVDQIYGDVSDLSKETIERYIDYDKLGRDLSFDGQWIEYDNGFIEIF